MVQKCIVSTCSSMYKKGLCTKMHRFPKDNHIRNLWIEAIKKSDSEFKDHWRVCSIHFSVSDYDEDGSLKPDAIPVLAFPSKIRKISECDDVHNLQPFEFADVTHLSSSSSDEEDKDVFISRTSVSGTLTTRGTQTTPMAKCYDNPENVKLREKIRNMQRCLNRRTKELESIKDLLRHVVEKENNSDNLLELK